MSLYVQHIDHCFDAQPAVTRAEYEALLAETKPAMASLLEKKRSGVLPLFALPEYEGDLAEIESVAADIRKQFDALVVIGTGGSSLGGKTLTTLHGETFGAAPEFPVHFLENVDPVTLDRLLAQCDLPRTCFLAISKSGSTLETVSQMLLCLDAVQREVGEAASYKQFIAITVPGSSPLRDFCEKHGVRLLDHDPKVGGRFSVLSLVGLIPAAVAGINVRKVRQGAASVIKTIEDAPEACAPAVGAAINEALRRAGATVSVVMPYCDRLAHFGMWYRQLWAESLGKDGIGTIPVRAMGAIDQHSQMQLYLGGAKDKFYTFILLDSRGQGRAVNPKLTAGDDRLAYMSGKTLGDIMVAEQEGTERTFVRNSCPTRVLSLKTLNEEVLGALLMHYMVETVIAADLMGIDAYDQPAVEESKILAREILTDMKAKVAA